MSIHTCKLNNILYLCHRKQDYPMCMRVYLCRKGVLLTGCKRCQSPLRPFYCLPAKNNELKKMATSCGLIEVVHV